MNELNFMGRKVVMDIKHWGNQLIITIRGGFNLSELDTIKEEAERLIKNLGCSDDNVKIYVRETTCRLTIVVTPLVNAKK